MKAFFLLRKQLVWLCTILGLLLLGTWIYRNLSENSNIDENASLDSMVKAVQVGTSSVVPTYRAEFVETNNTRTTPEEIFKAHRYGALGKVTLRVVDTDGQPVPDAQVDIGFVIFDKGARSQIGRTDRNGLFSAEGQVSWSIGWTITKDGYYSTVGDYLVQRAKDPRQLKNGRWQPWNPTIVVVLKDKKSPTQLQCAYVSARIPIDVVSWYDCLSNAWLPPLGNGKHGDISVLFNSSYTGSGLATTNQIVVGFGENGGCIKLRKDSFSDNWSVYSAPEHGYAKNIQFRLTRSASKIYEKTELGRDEYLVFLSSRETNEQSDKSKPLFGTLSSFEFGDMDRTNGVGYVKFTCIFNPERGNNNLETAEAF